MSGMVETFKDVVDLAIKQLPGNFKHAVLDWRIIVCMTVCFLAVSLCTEALVGYLVNRSLEKERMARISSASCRDNVSMVLFRKETCW